MGREPEDILILEAGGIGDAVMATPALSAVRARFPGARISIVLAPRTMEIVRALDLGFDIITLRLGQKIGQLKDAMRLIMDSRRRQPDVLIDLSAVESSGAELKRRLLVTLIGARRSVGRNTNGRGTFFDDAMDESLFDPEHEVRRKVRLLAPLGIEVADPRPALNVPEAADEAAGALVAGAGIGADHELIGINPGSFLPTRRWPHERFIRLAAELGEAPARAVLVTGGEQERELVATVADAVPGPVLRAVARPLMEVAALLARCRILITNDTGAMHIAAAQDVPVVAVFGRSNASRYRPWLPDERYVVLQAPADVCEEFSARPELAECRKTSCASGVCMQSIPYESVAAAANELLERTQGA